MRRTNQEGIALIKRFESFSPRIYICPAGFKTIGYGHKILKGENYSEASKVSEDMAHTILQADIERAERAVQAYICASINDNQFSALVSFTYNLGAGCLQRSTLRQKINYGSSVDEVSHEFGKWVYARGRKLRGLIFRRAQEAELYQMHF